MCIRDSINTGWNGSGERISIKETRRIIDAILNGDIENASFTNLPYFNLAIPQALGEVDPGILDPRNTYAEAGQWDEKARNLATLFVDNFTKYEDTEEGKALAAAGPALH